MFVFYPRAKNVRKIVRPVKQGVHVFPTKLDSGPLWFLLFPLPVCVLIGWFMYRQSHTNFLNLEKEWVKRNAAHLVNYFVKLNCFANHFQAPCSTHVKIVVLRRKITITVASYVLWSSLGQKVRRATQESSPSTHPSSNPNMEPIPTGPPPPKDNAQLSSMDTSSSLPSIIGFPSSRWIPVSVPLMTTIVVAKPLYHLTLCNQSHHNFFACEWKSVCLTNNSA